MILEQIVEKKKIRLLERKKIKTFESVLHEAKNMPKNTKIFYNSLKKEGELSVIAEVKKASPSKGIISEEFDYIKIAECYEKNGASAISILTEEDFFKGNDAYLINIKEKLNIPILRKDFIIDEYQIYESKILGAHCILLICRILSDEQLRIFYKIATELGLDCLFETHNEDEVKRAVQLGAQIIGVNNRNLDTFEVDLKISEDLIKYIPSNIIRVSESGISHAKDMERLLNAGFDATLIGESLMKLKGSFKDIRR